MNAKADVHRTLQYGRDKIGRQFLAFTLPAFAIGLYGVFIDGSDKLSLPSWALLLVGGTWSAYELFRSLFPGAPVLVLSPEGIHFQLDGFNPFLIPWSEIRSVDTVDIKTWSGISDYPFAVKFPRVTVVMVPRKFYDSVILDNSPGLPSSGWDNTFIQKGMLVGIALHHEILPVRPDELRQAIAMRWHAFRGANRAAGFLAPAGGDAEPPPPARQA